MITFQTISFGSFQKLNKNSKPADSAFFRDYPALQSAVDTIKENFPKGANVLDYACANGEEAISIYSLLKDRGKDFKITGLDIDENLISLAQNGIYTISPSSSDAFLLKGKGTFKEERYLSSLFENIMTRETKTTSSDNFSDGLEIRNYRAYENNQIPSYKLKSGDAGNIVFRQGDLYEIDGEKDDNVGAVCFRNAFYHLMDHHDGEELYTNNIGHFEQTKTFEEKEAIANKIIQKIRKKLEIGGVFIMGSSINEWIFIAPDYAPDEDTVKFGDTAQYKKQKTDLQNAIYYVSGMKDLIGYSLEGSSEKYQYLTRMLERLEKAKDIRILKKTPIQTALEKDGNFKPVHFSEVENFIGLEVPTVWVKVK